MRIDKQERPSLPYTVRETNNVRTGKKCRRAFTQVKQTTTLSRLSQNMANDRGLMAGKPSFVRSFLIAAMDSIVDELKQGHAVTIDNYLRLTPTFRGSVDPDTGNPTNKTEVAIAVQTLQKLKFPIRDFNLVNCGTEVKVPKISCLWSCNIRAPKDTLIRGRRFSINGSDLYYDDAMGDTITLGYLQDGTRHEIAIVPTDCASNAFLFDFPPELENAANGTAVEIVLTTRCGVEDGIISTVCHTVTLSQA